MESLYQPCLILGGTKGGGENPERAGSLGAPLRSEEDRTVFATTPVTQFPRRPPALLQVAKPQAKPVLNVYVGSFFFLTLLNPAFLYLKRRNSLYKRASLKARFFSHLQRLLSFPEASDL